MALVVHTSRDVVSLPDYGLTGVDGARFILARITPFTARIDVPRNRLGSEGVTVLAQGLYDRWRQWSDPKSDSHWGLDELNLAGVELGDRGLEAVLQYIGADSRLQRLMLQNNELVLEESALAALLSTLNAPSSCLKTLSLSNNPLLSHASIARLFETLDSTSLEELHISACNLGPTLGRPVASYLRSPRSHRIQRLELNANALGSAAVLQVIDALEQANFTLAGRLGLFANEPSAAVPTDDDGIALTPIEPSEPIEGLEEQTEAVETALPLALARNRILTRRVRQAAYRTLAPARVILQGRPPTVNEIAGTILDSLPSPGATGSLQQPFNVLALPSEIVHTIVRHIKDPDAFSTAQWTKFVGYAGDRKTIGLSKDVFLARVDMERWQLSQPRAVD